jgi:hypothetical protein
MIIGILALTLQPGCSNDEPIAPTTGILAGRVTDASSSTALGSVRITLFDALTNNPLGTFTTAADGTYRMDLTPGSYYLRFARQGFQPVPPFDIPPLPISVTAGATTDNSIQMFRSSVANGGAIRGKVISGGKPMAGVLVVAESGTAGSSSLSDLAGDYSVCNLVPATYTIKAWVAGYSSTKDTLAVAAGSEQTGVTLTLTADQLGTVSGHITFLATTNTEVDVALLNPATREVVPGLTAVTVGGNYSISNVPYGTYLARATYRNDGKVMDPDWIIKNGEPLVTVAAAAVNRDFSVTGAVSLTAPTNIAADTQPVNVQMSGLTFTWSQYSSADNYVIEVTDQSGRVIWGGFGGNWTIRKIILPKTQTGVAFNSDTTATEGLIVGKVYRWKVYVSKNDSQEPLGWKLISASEDQQGMFKIVP